MTAPASPACDRTTAADFLTALFGRLPEGAHAYTWHKQGQAKQTHWFDREHLPDAARRAADASDRGADVYAGIGLSAKPRGAGARLKLPDVCGIVGFVADVDFDKPGAAKRYAPDAPAALALIEASPLAPTVIVHSGHGLQAWWLFPEPWMFGDAGELAGAAALSEAWGKHLQALAKERGLDLDSVHDLPRIMRVAGTVNRKDPSAPVLVSVLRNGGPRHEPETFRAHLPANAQPELGDASDREPAAPRTRGTRQAPAAAARCEFPAAKHEALYANDELYRRTWDRDRPDLKDQSPNAYDMALANICARADLDFEDIAAILYERRRRHGEDPEKALRPDYLKLTIGKALALVRGEQIVAGQAEPKSREEAVAALASSLNIPLTKIQRITGAEDRWRFTISGQVAELTVAATSNRTSFENSVWTKCGKVPRTPKKADDWRRCRELMWAAAEVIDAGDEASLDGELRSWLAAYLAGNRPVELGPGELVEYAGHPFLRDGRVWFKLTELLRYLHVSLGVKITQGLLCQRLVAVGAIQSNAIRVKDGKNKPKQGRYWAVTWATDDAEEADDAEE